MATKTNDGYLGTEIIKGPLKMAILCSTRNAEYSKEARYNASLCRQCSKKVTADVSGE